MQHEAINVVAIIVIASFAIERVTSGLLFLLSFFKPWQRFVPDPFPSDALESAKYQKREKVAYYGIAGTIVLVLVLSVRDLSVLSALSINAPRLLDLAVSWLVLVAGSDRIFELVARNQGMTSSGKETRPLMVSGKLTIEPYEKTAPAVTPLSPK